MDQDEFDERLRKDFPAWNEAYRRLAKVLGMPLEELWPEVPKPE